MERTQNERRPTPEEPWTIGRLLTWTEKFLAGKGIEFPRLDTQLLLAHVLECSRIQLYTRYEEEPPEEARQRFKDLIRRRLEGCPVAYLIGRKEFFSLEFEVTPAVLIPRPDTETLVVECLRLARNLPAPTILDIGTGSGAIAIALAHQLPAARLTAVDLSEDALALARRNADKHGVGDRISFVPGDLFASLPPAAAFDFIVSNPPYIPHEDIATLPVGVRDYEPHQALDGGPGGFAIFDRLISEAVAHLHPGGHLLVEIGSPQEEPARARLQASGRYDLYPTVKDGSGHPRVLIARRV